MSESDKTAKVESARVTAAREKLAAAQKARTDAVDKLKAEQESEEAVLARLEEQERQEQREAARLRHEAEGEKAFRAACAKYGGEHRVARVHTVNGPVVLRCATEVESKDLEVQHAALGNGAERVTVAVEAMLDQVVYPSRDTVRAWLGEYPNLDGHLLHARNELVDGMLKEVRGKG